MRSDRTRGHGRDTTRIPTVGGTLTTESALWTTSNSTDGVCLDALCRHIARTISTLNVRYGKDSFGMEKIRYLTVILDASARFSASRTHEWWCLYARCHAHSGSCHRGVTLRRAQCRHRGGRPPSGCAGRPRLGAGRGGRTQRCRATHGTMVGHIRRPHRAADTVEPGGSHRSGR